MAEPFTVTPEQVYRDAAREHLRAVHDPADVDWYVDTQASMPGHRAAVESAYRAGWDDALDGL